MLELTTEEFEKILILMESKAKYVRGKKNDFFVLVDKFWKFKREFLYSSHSKNHDVKVIIKMEDNN